MNWLALADWQVVLSLVTPAIVGCLMCFLETRGPLARLLQQPNGLVPGYFAAVGTLFGLVTALLMSDVWHKENAAFQSILAEDDAMRAVLQLTHVNAVEATINPAIKAYAAAAGRESPASSAPDDARHNTDQAYQALLAAAAQAQGPARAELMAACSELRRARDRRLSLADDRTAMTKWLSVLVLGALTQLALLFVHVGNRRAMRLAVGMFTVAFTFCLAIIAIFDDPLETVLADEPRAIFSETISAL